MKVIPLAGTFSTYLGESADQIQVRMTAEAECHEEESEHFGFPAKEQVWTVRNRQFECSRGLTPAELAALRAFIRAGEFDDCLEPV